MAVDNPFTRIVERYAWLPPRVQRPLVSRAVARTIPFVGTAGLSIEKMTETEVAARLPDGHAVHNHIGGLHAGAMALLAETATGLVVAMNVAGHCAPLIRTLNVSFRRQAKGALRAVASLSPDEAERIQTTDVGKLTVPVRITDEADKEPLETELEWAWIPKRRIPGMSSD